MRYGWLLIGILVAVVGMTGRLAWESIGGENAQPAYAQQDGCFVVEEFEGNGDTTTPPFDISGEQFFVNYSAVNTGPPEVPGILGVIVSDAGGNQVGNARLDGEGSNVLSVDQGPGQFTIEIISAEVDYTITVEDCAADSSAEEVEDAPVEADPPTGGSTSFQQPPSGRQYSNELLESGGSIADSLPLMPDGSCPEEVPVKNGNTCSAK